MERNKSKKQVTVLDGRNENNPELYEDIADIDIQYTWWWSHVKMDLKLPPEPSDSSETEASLKFLKQCGVNQIHLTGNLY